MICLRFSPLKEPVGEKGSKDFRAPAAVQVQVQVAVAVKANVNVNVNDYAAPGELMLAR